MDDKLFKELEANLQEAVEVAKGASKPKSAYVVQERLNTMSITRVKFDPTDPDSFPKGRINYEIVDSTRKLPR